jgi:hypothetical protein
MGSVSAVSVASSDDSTRSHPFSQCSNQLARISPPRREPRPLTLRPYPRCRARPTMDISRRTRSMLCGSTLARCLRRQLRAAIGKVQQSVYFPFLGRSERIEAYTIARFQSIMVGIKRSVLQVPPPSGSLFGHHSIFYPPLPEGDQPLRAMRSSLIIAV